MSATGYIAEVPGKGGTPALRFDYEPITEAERDSIREGWRKLDDATQVNEAVDYLLHHISSCQVLTNRPPLRDAKTGSIVPRDPWEDVQVNEHNLRTKLPKGHFARMLWIAMGVHESDPVPGTAADPSVPSWAVSKANAAPPAEAPESAAVDRQAKDPASPPIAPAEPEKPATVDASTSTPDQAAATEQTK